MFTRVRNRNETKTLRRCLRTGATIHERIVWSKLRNTQLGVRFRRQYAIGPYILDFYCPTHRIAIEIDGMQHGERATYDAQRTAFLNTYGIRVLRFGNNEVNTNLEGVLLTIRDAIEHATPPQPSPL